MARRPRADTPGSWHHVINRAIAKRPYFEARSDKRYFLARLAFEVRAGRLEVHAFCLMTTHFHLLVRSPIGELSEAMRRIQCAYSRFFNRRRRRDGPLIRARFFSKRVGTDSYRRTVVRYIDANAVRAGIVAVSAEHEFGSARYYLAGPRPIWLSSDWVVQRALELSGSAEFSASAYLAAFGPRTGEDLDSLRELIELRMASSCELDPLDDLVGKTPGQVRQWMVRKARLADGMEIGLPVCGPPAVRRALDRHLDAQGEWLVDRDSRTWRGSQLAQSGLLRDLCCMPFGQIARLSRISVWKATRDVELHRISVAEGGDYAATVSEIAHQALATTIPDGR
ncbi:MAG: REP element-mobilizing transposase RayT [Planctomycetota bacterium]|jgi:REP element-mobilizing transposase RayT